MRYEEAEALERVATQLHFVLEGEKKDLSSESYGDVKRMIADSKRLARRRENR